MESSSPLTEKKHMKQKCLANKVPAGLEADVAEPKKEDGDFFSWNNAQTMLTSAAEEEMKRVAEFPATDVLHDSFGKPVGLATFFDGPGKVKEMVDDAVEVCPVWFAHSFSDLLCSWNASACV
jgi:hypothetical protein